MEDWTKDCLCINCELLKSTDKNGYITCPHFTRKEAKECGMTVFLHCFCSEGKPKEGRAQ